jgi:hypothetical protein
MDPYPGNNDEIESAFCILYYLRSAICDLRLSSFLASERTEERRLGLEREKHPNPLSLSKKSR